jgi:hypothetical protein
LGIVNRGGTSYIYWFKRPNQNELKPYKYISLCDIGTLSGIVLILFSAFYLKAATSYPGWWGLLPTAGASLIIFFGEKSIFGKFFSCKILVYIGLISYPLYLWHWGTLSYFHLIQGDKLPIELTLLALFLSIFLAFISYAIIETRLGKSNQSTVTILILLAFVLTFIGYQFKSNKGYDNRVALSNSPYKQMDYDLSEYYKNCNNIYPQFGRYCSLSKAKNANILIIGDSHAEDLFPGIAKKASGSVLSITGAFCKPYFGNVSFNGDRALCENVIGSALKFAGKTKEIDTVIMTSMGDPESDYSAHQNNFELEKSVRETFNYLQQNGKKIIFLFDRPMLNRPITDCLDIRPIRFPYSIPDCSQSKIQVDKNRYKYKEFFHKILKDYPQIEIFDSETLFCANQKCFAHMGKKSLYRDTHHSTIFGSEVIANELFQRALLK